MESDRLVDMVEGFVRDAEVNAVANRIRENGKVQVGQIVDYQIDFPGAAKMSATRSSSRPYRLAIEQWHIDSAEAMLRVSGVD